ncbi:MAG: hypothetical protein ACKOI1_03160, partial [Bacteroidota bacterium]
MQKLFVTVGISCLFALTANAKKGNKAKTPKSKSKAAQQEQVAVDKEKGKPTEKRMVVSPARKSPIDINDPSLGLNNMVTLQPGKTWVWLGDYFPYLSAIDSVTVPKNHPGSSISNLRFSWYRGELDSMQSSGAVCDSMQLWWEGDNYGKETALQYFQIWSAGKSTTVPVRKSEKVLREFRWKTKTNAYSAVKVKGTFNAWNANNLSLRWEEDPTDKTQGSWVGSTWVGPGSHQYVFVV